MYIPSPILVAMNKMEELKRNIQECNTIMVEHKDTPWIVEQAISSKLILQKKLRELIG